MPCDSIPFTPPRECRLMLSPCPYPLPLPLPSPQLLQAHGDAPRADGAAGDEEVELVPQAAPPITVVRIQTPCTHHRFQLFSAATIVRLFSGARVLHLPICCSKARS